MQTAALYKEEPHVAFRVSLMLGEGKGMVHGGFACGRIYSLEFREQFGVGLSEQVAGQASNRYGETMHRVPTSQHPQASNSRNRPNPQF